MKKFDVIVIGGGAAGFFAAINIAQLNRELKIAILERGKEVLTKVRISGGGRCNVTHAEFIPKELTLKYPRGEKELLGPFHTFMTGDTISWFEARGIELKIEEDGRMFPVSDSSESIISCFLNETEKLGIQLYKNESVQKIENSDGWKITTNHSEFFAPKILMATGSNPKMWNLLQELGHDIIAPVPSLFTFNIKDERIEDLPGISTYASVKVIGENLEDSGPLLITHWGVSGPAILKLSAWGATVLNARNYQFNIEVNWLPEHDTEMLTEDLKDLKRQFPKQNPGKYSQLGLPKRLWRNLTLAAGIGAEASWAELNKEQLQQLVLQLTRCTFMVNGKSTFKEEFVTAGGVKLKEVNFKTYESKLLPNLYFAGEILNIDAITGGFNFQNAWTGAFIAATSIANTAITNHFETD